MIVRKQMSTRYLKLAIDIESSVIGTIKELQAEGNKNITMDQIRDKMNAELGKNVIVRKDIRRALIAICTRGKRV
jgi:hypothetical protein